MQFTLKPPGSDSAAPLSLGARLAWVSFLATSVHLVFLQPYLVVIPGERAKVFSGIWCILSLLLVLIFQRSKAVTWKSPPVIISFALLGLALISSFCAPNQASSLARAFVIMSAGLGGYWGARLLLQTTERQRYFLWFSLILGASILLLCVSGIWAAGKFFFFFEEHYHPVGSRIILLSFAPLALLFSHSRLKISLGVLLLGVSYLVLISAGKNGMSSAVFIPIMLGLLAVSLRTWPVKQMIIILCILFVVSAVAGNLLRTILANKYPESVDYRIENVRFSWHLALKHPFFGIGLWTMREQYLQDYEVKYPSLSGEVFSFWTRKFTTSENNLLTFMADLGFPFVLLYSAGVIVILVRLMGRALQPPLGAVLPPLALLLPLMGEILHFQVFDGLFHPQVSWFFHILLGLAAPSTGNYAPIPGVRKGFVVRFLTFGAAITGGAALGIIL